MRVTTSGPTPVPPDRLGSVVRSLNFADATPALRADTARRARPAARPGAAPPDARPHAAIRVVLRIRPLSAREARRSAQSCVLPSAAPTEFNIRPLDPKRHPVAIRAAGKATFKFSTIFRADAAQDAVFEATALPLIDGLFNGCSAVVFAYGVTSSGKTWTIQGTNHHPGILPRSLDVIVNSIAVAKGDGLAQDTAVSHGVEQLVEGTNRKRRTRAKPAAKVHDSNYIPVDGNVHYTIFASYLEVYNEQVYDLFETVPASVKEEPTTTDNPKREPFVIAEDDSSASFIAHGDTQRPTFKRRILKLKEDSSGEVYADGQTECEIKSGADIDRLLEFGQKNRSVAHTTANEHSSRSHAIFIITLKQSHTVEHPGLPPKTFRSSSKLYIVDLAGSERTSRTNNSGTRLKEATNINTSLMNLGRCLNVIRQNQRMQKRDPSKTLQVVPFRHSRLTRLLQHSLSSGSAVMIANVSPFVHDADETIHALRCAAIAREVTVVPSKTNRVLADCTNTINSTAVNNMSAPDKNGTTEVQQSARRTRRLRAKTQENDSSRDAEKTISSLKVQLEVASRTVEESEKRVADLAQENKHLKSEMEEVVMDLAAERKEFDSLFRENERLKDRLIDAEARFRYMEAEIREEVSQEAEQLIKEVQDRCEKQVRDALDKKEDVKRKEYSTMSHAERKQYAAQVARRISRASIAAIDGIALNFGNLDEDGEEGFEDGDRDDSDEYVEEDEEEYIEEEDESLADMEDEVDFEDDETDVDEGGGE